MNRAYRPYERVSAVSCHPSTPRVSEATDTFQNRAERREPIRHAAMSTLYKYQWSHTRVLSVDKKAPPIKEDQ